MRGEYGRAVTEGLGGFEAPGELLKAWDEEGVWRFEGVAATGGLDRQSERLTAKALGKIARSQGVELRAAHRAGPIGVVEECWVSGDEVRVRGKLEAQSAEAAAVYTRLRRGERLGLSVGGKVTGARWAWDAEVERPVRLIEDVELSHVAVCKAEEAVNPGTWVRVAAAAEPALKGRSGGERPSGTREAGGTPAHPVTAAEMEAEALTPGPSPVRPQTVAGTGESETADGAGRSPADADVRGPTEEAEEAERRLPTPNPSLKGGEPETATAGRQVAGPSDGGETASDAGRSAGPTEEAEETEGRLPTPSPSLKGGGPETATAGPQVAGPSDGGETANGAGRSPRPTEDEGTAGEADRMSVDLGAAEMVEKVVVRRGEPQGLSGSYVRPVTGARLWEGVL